MSEYQKVLSTLELSKSIIFYLEMAEPKRYDGMNRGAAIRAVNDILQGRSDRPLDDLMDELRQKGGAYYAGEIGTVQREIQAFQAQRALLSQPYSKYSDKSYKFKTYEGGPKPLKIINQQLFDWAAQAGFPPGFFRESYFDGVTIYCLPDRANLNFSVFQDCTFAVCRIQDARFDGASIYSSEFHSCAIDHTTFFQATLANTHFHDSSLNWVSFQSGRLNRCNILDCTLDSVSFMRTILDGCSFGRVQASNTRCLKQAFITQSGATKAECLQNKTAIFTALGIAEDALPHRGKRAASERTPR